MPAGPNYLLVSFETARKLSKPCVYAFMDGDTPVYIGKTKDPSSRFESYQARKCHNMALSDWLKSRSNEFSVRIYYALDIHSLEKTLIKAHKKTLFNMTDGDEAKWFIQSREQSPWVAGRGILSPISEFLRKWPRDEVKDAVKAWLESSTTKERCLAEIEVAMAQPMRHHKWLAITTPKMLAVLES